METIDILETQRSDIEFSIQKLNETAEALESMKYNESDEVRNLMLHFLETTENEILNQEAILQQLNDEIEFIEARKLK